MCVMSCPYFLLCLVVVFVVGVPGTYADCKATVSSFSTQDATILTQLGYVAEFLLECKSSSNFNLFAELPCGKVVPAAKVKGSSYQVSWVEDLKQGRGGTVQLRLFNEDGYANLRKAQRDGDQVSSIKSLLDITVTTKSAYKGPWVKAELLAAFIVGGVAYFAITSKSKVQS